jgi:osmoprotectant transport system substrate-binding protein
MMRPRLAKFPAAPRATAAMTRGLLGLAVLFALAGCSKSDAVVVGSKNFTEQRVLGELLAQTIEAAGLPVDRRLDLGGTFVCDSALRAGQIDVYVEYTGTALGAILKEPAATAANAATVLDQVRAAYAPAGLMVTTPLGFDNTFALIVRGDTEAQTISEATPLAKNWRAAFGYEFQQRADGYPALTATYGLTFPSIHTMDLGLLYRALLDKQADVVVGNATDAAIARFSLRVLDDDRHAFPDRQVGRALGRFGPRLVTQFTEWSLSDANNQGLRTSG